MQYPVTEQRVLGHEAQSESQNALSWSSIIEDSKIPCPRATLIYQVSCEQWPNVLMWVIHKLTQKLDSIAYVRSSKG